MHTQISNFGELNMKVIMISHDDIDENRLIEYFKNILDQRCAIGSLKSYEIRIITKVKKIEE